MLRRIESSKNCPNYFPFFWKVSELGKWGGNLPLKAQFPEYAVLNADREIVYEPAIE
jgi:hypothetical protein